jgi:hypothetical protein
VNDEVENEPQASSTSRRAALILSRLKPEATQRGLGNSTIIVRCGYLRDAITRWISSSSSIFASITCARTS